MDKFTKLTATACPINQANLNTDQILPARYLKWTRAMGIGKVLFQDLRFDAEGNEKPDFPINRPAWRKAKIVVGARTQHDCRHLGHVLHRNFKSAISTPPHLDPVDLSGRVRGR